MTGVRSVLGGLRVPASPFHLARVSPSLRLIQRTGKGMGEGTQVQGTQIYGCTVYHGVSLLPHKLGDTGPPLISLFNLRVVTSFEMYNVCNREFFEHPSKRFVIVSSSKNDIIIMLRYYWISKIF